MVYKTYASWAIVGFAVASTVSAEDVWKMQDSGVKASLRGLCVVDRKTVWASGSEGTVIRTVDGGREWRDVSVTGARKLDFRDIHAFDANNAVAISAGQPARIYRTDNAGKSWKMCFDHPDPRSFFDALSFWDQQHGLAMSDPIDGHVLLIESVDGGNSWNELPLDRRPSVLPGEAGFAASGTNMQIVGEQILVALGGASPGKPVATSRIVFSADRAKTWQAATAPIERGESSGIFSLAFSDERIGVAVGGDYLKPYLRTGNMVRTRDGGRSWQTGTGQPPRGYRSGVAAFRTGKQTAFICVGPGGTDISRDDGQSWTAVSNLGFHAIAFDPTGTAGFASGSDGRVATWPQDFQVPK